MSEHRAGSRAAEKLGTVRTYAGSPPRPRLSPADVADLPLVALPGLLAELAALQAAVAARLAEVAVLEQPAPPAEKSGEPDRLLSVVEAAARLGVAPRWLHRHWHSMPCARKVGRMLRFSEVGLSRWMDRQRPRESS